MGGSVSKPLPDARKRIASLVAADSNIENAPGTPILRHLHCVCDGPEMMA
jgi:hypothetical protein